MNKDAINAYKATQKIIEDHIVSVPNLRIAHFRSQTAARTSEGRIETLNGEIKEIKRRHNFFTRKLLRIPFPFGKDGKKFRAKKRELKREKKMLKQLKFIEKHTEAKIKANMKVIKRAQKKGNRLGKMLKRTYRANFDGIKFMQTLKENHSDIRLMYGDQVLQDLQSDAKRIQQKQYVLDIKQKAKLLDKHLKLFQSGKSDKIDLLDMKKLINPNLEERAAEEQDQGTRGEPNIFREAINLKYLTERGVSPKYFKEALDQFNLENNMDLTIPECILFMGITRLEGKKMPQDSSLEAHKAMANQVYQKIKAGDIGKYKDSKDVLMKYGVAAFNAGRQKDATNLTIDEFFGKTLAEYYNKIEQAAKDRDRFSSNDKDKDKEDIEVA